MKMTNLRIIYVPKEEEKSKSFENVFEEIIEKNYTGYAKDLDIQIPKAQRTPQEFIAKILSPRHIHISLSKVKIKKRILRTVRQKHQVTYKGKPIR